MMLRIVSILGGLSDTIYWARSGLVPALARLGGAQAPGSCHSGFVGVDHYVDDMKGARIGSSIAANRAGLDIGQEMIRQGWAVPYWRYGGARYSKDFGEAATANAGMHAGTFIAPEQWRRGQRGKARSATPGGRGLADLSARIEKCREVLREAGAIV